jgi:hypothetical protein
MLRSVVICIMKSRNSGFYWPGVAMLATLGMVSAFAASNVAPPFYGDPPDDNHPWAVHDRNRPLPPVITPGTFSTQDQAGKPPSDAIVLFDGTDLSKFSDNKGNPVKWVVRDGYMEVTPGSGEIRSREEFGDCQLHIEWCAPTKIEGSGQGRGNSGVFLPGGLEIQVLDNYNNPTYADGTAGAYYGVMPPLVTAVRPPGQWQVYDIVFRRPVYKDGKVVDPGYVTVFLNGVLVQDHTPLEGAGGHMGRSRPRPFPEKGPLRLQDHGNPTRFRNIWYRPLPPRPSQGGTDGFLSPEATLAKRKEIAATIREDAAKLANPANPIPEMMRWMESLVYEAEPSALKKVEQMASAYVASLKALPPEKLQGKRDEARSVRDAFRYLVRAKAITNEFGPKVELENLIRDQGWDKQKK